MRRCLVIIARDRPELWLTWASFYGGTGTVQLVVDRRHTPGTWRAGHVDRRTQPHGEMTLRERGFLVIPEPETVCQ
jgi:hypothetical protein